MDGPRGYYAKWNKSEWEGQILYDFTYMWNLKNKTETDSETQRTGGCQRGKGGMTRKK